MALISVGLFGVTGFYSAWAHTGELLPLETEYGRTLGLKTAAALVALAIGAVNFLGADRLSAWLDGLASRVRIELALVAVVLALTAMLATTPPLEEARGIAIQPIPDAFGAVAPDMALTVVPGRPGVNRVMVRTTDSLASLGLALSLERIDEAGSTRVPLTLAGQGDMDHAAMSGPDDGTVDWHADALVLPPGSSWDATVHIVGKSGDEFGRQRFAFAFGDDGVDDGRLTDVLTAGSAIAFLLGAGGALALGLGFGGVGLPRCDAAASRVALVSGGAVSIVLGLVIGIERIVSL